MKGRTPEATRALVETVATGLARETRQVKILGEIAWSHEVETKFFAQGAKELPEVTYPLDRTEVEERIAALLAVEKAIDGDDEVATWLRNVVHAYLDGNRLLLAVGTKDFYRISLELYGGSRTRVTPGGPPNIELATHLVQRLEINGWDEAFDEPPETMTDEMFAEAIRARLAARRPPFEIEVSIDDGCAAKVLAGMHRVRVRRGATFEPSEVDALWHHEVETHVLSALNGAHQPLAPFLQAGGPRSTRVQEGLAIFSELYHHVLTIERMQRLATRVRLVEMAEEGASFLDLYRHLIGRGTEPHDAYFDAQRVCRGGLVEGGAPFTKDVVYLAGLLEVYTFLRALVRGGHRDETELVVCGRFALEDMPALVQLRHAGILERPAYLPDWLVNWRALLPYFAFTSFAGEVDDAPIEKQFRRVVELAAAQRPPEIKG